MGWIDQIVQVESEIKEYTVRVARVCAILLHITK